VAGVERTKKRADEVSQVSRRGRCADKDGAWDKTASKRRLGPSQVSHVSGRRLARSARALETEAGGRGVTGANAADRGMQRGQGGNGSGWVGGGNGSGGVLAVVVLTGAACRVWIVGGAVGPDMGGSAAEEEGKCGRSAREQAGRRGMRVQ
jgi:hypothetical protein